MTKTAAQLTEGDLFIPAGRTHAVEVLMVTPVPRSDDLMVAYFLPQGGNVLRIGRDAIVEVLA